MVFKSSNLLLYLYHGENFPLPKVLITFLLIRLLFVRNKLHCRLVYSPLKSSVKIWLLTMSVKILYVLILSKGGISLS